MINTPWGRAQHSNNIARGITFYSTASHGGFKLSDTRRLEMPSPFREEDTWAGGNWYEEDCDSALVIYCFPQFFPENQVKAAENMLRSYKPHLMKDK
ncbi:MAG: hypothetical protein DWQ19_13010 [Crenarchaeota archaeon]|nr:MAG: hypothetical protein DWQ19_13010 [Thermoproteota archaeon]